MKYPTDSANIDTWSHSYWYSIPQPSGLALDPGIKWLNLIELKFPGTPFLQKIMLIQSNNIGILSTKVK